MAQQELVRGPANAVDQRLLLNAARMSPAELSADIGGLMNPAQVAAHVKRLLAERDWLTEAEQDMLTTQKMQAALAKLESKYQDYENLALQLKYLKEIGVRLDKRREATQIDLNTYSANVGREMGRIFDMALAYMKGALSHEIDADTWDDAADAALEHAQTEAMRKAIGE